MRNNIKDDHHLLIFGLGYAATAIKEKAGNRFKSITATYRSKKTFSDDACHYLPFDGNRISEELDHAISKATHILVSIGPDKDGDPVLNATQDLLNCANNLVWIGYLSTVGVYGDHNGAWVNEETKCRPISDRSIIRLATEKAWQEITVKINVPLAVFRLAGIYGPGRNALVNIERGRSRRLVKKGQVFNRIHRDDIAQAVDKAIELKAGGIFNVADDEPAPPQGVVSYVHQLHGTPPPPEIDFKTADITTMARSFYGENKRVSNAKTKSVLAMQYTWPDYRTAYKAMWDNDSWR